MTCSVAGLALAITLPLLGTAAPDDPPQETRRPAAGARTAVYLEVGSRHPDDLTTCSDIDMKSANADGRFVHKDGTPYPDG